MGEREGWDHSTKVGLPNGRRGAEWDDSRARNRNNGARGGSSVNNAPGINTLE